MTPPLAPLPPGSTLDISYNTYPLVRIRSSYCQQGLVDIVSFKDLLVDIPPLKLWLVEVSADVDCGHGGTHARRGALVRCPNTRLIQHTKTINIMAYIYRSLKSFLGLGDSVLSHGNILLNLYRSEIFSYFIWYYFIEYSVLFFWSSFIAQGNISLNPLIAFLNNAVSFIANGNILLKISLDFCEVFFYSSC